MTRLMSKMNAKIDEQGVQLGTVVQFLANRDGSGSSGMSQMNVVALRSRLPCHSKHTLRALDNDLSANDLLYRDLVSAMRLEWETSD